jgi:hypothetical protein
VPSCSIAIITAQRTLTSEIDRWAPIIIAERHVCWLIPEMAAVAEGCTSIVSG